MKSAALSVVSWLLIGCGSRSTVAPVTDGMLIAVTNAYRCVARGGRVWCWGADDVGQTGGGAASSAGVHEPREVPNLAEVVELAASDGHACARLASGRVKCWGANVAGEVGSASAPAGTCTWFYFDAGPSDAPCQPRPTEVPGVEGAVQLSLGDARSCARLSGGAIKCWGLGVRGAEWLPMQADVRDMALGNQDACVVASAGMIRCSAATLETVAGWRDIARVAMSAQNSLSCVLRSGAVDCWGDNYAGQRGIGNTDPNIPLPGDPPAVADGAQAVAIGASHVCALMGGGGVQCWGRNTSGAIGQPISATANCSAGPCQLTARAVDLAAPMVNLAAGGDTTCTADDRHRLYCWGGLVSQENGGDGRVTYTPGPWEQL